MKFSVDINEQEIFPVIYLRNDEEKTLAEIYTFGALLNAFKVSDSENIIDGFTSPEDAKNNITNSFKSAKLSPFVCRIKNAKYFFNDHEHSIGKFFLGKEAIHGLLYDAVFSIIDHDANNENASVVLQYQYTKKNEGFPFNYTCNITYRLQQNNSLTIITSIKNNSDAVMPICDGWHPYFKIGNSINDLLLQINASAMLEFNESLVPTGKIIANKKFLQPEIIGNTSLDNCFLLNDNNKPSCVLKSDRSGLELIIKADASYPYLQLFTPDHRNSIAIENLSAAPDAFNNKAGLKLLKPGEELSFKTTYCVSVIS